MIRIDELHIRARGNNEEDGRALSKQLPEKLAVAIPEQERNICIPEIRVQLESASMEDTGELAARIAEQIIRRIKLEML